VIPIKFQGSYSPRNSRHGRPDNEHTNGNKYRVGDLCENYGVIFGDGGGNQRHAGKESHNIENY
jgi:hypothetical protein